LRVPQLRQLLDAMDEWYAPQWAESWDAVGLVCGDRDEEVTRVLLAVDPVAATVDEAIKTGAQLLITHHPLLLSGVHGVPADDPKGALIHRMIRHGVAHFAAHTNADVADPGVSDALAQRLGLRELRPLEAQTDELDKLIVFVPTADLQAMIDALAAAGAGRLGDYDRCAWTTEGIGTFRPNATASPAIGTADQIETVPESRVEMVVPRGRRAAVVAALRVAHRYEEPAFDLIPMLDVGSRRGTGRVGTIDAVPFEQFLAAAATALPATTWGLRAAGDPRQLIRTVAVCGGSGASYLGAAQNAGADVYLTADLKHHSALDQRDHPMALIDAAHWATEAPWLDQVALRLRNRFGTTVDVEVSGHVTDPWNLHQPNTNSLREE
jgi:dinuclear metal center YbgI/SA1388 family protein